MSYNIGIQKLSSGVAQPTGRAVRCMTPELCNGDMAEPWCCTECDKAFKESSGEWKSLYCERRREWVWRDAHAKDEWELDPNRIPPPDNWRVMLDNIREKKRRDRGHHSTSFQPDNYAERRRLQCKLGNQCLAGCTADVVYCHHYFRKRRCRNGDNCPFVHK